MHKTRTTSEINSWVSWYENSEYVRPCLHGAGQIFGRKKTCTDPPFVYTGQPEPCTFLKRRTVLQS